MSWKKDDEVTITFQTLKMAQNEAFQDGIKFAASQIGYYLKDEITIAKVVGFLHAISKTEAYSTDDEECNCEEDCGADGCEASCDCGYEE
jgi:hypothetical protein